MNVTKITVGVVLLLGVSLGASTSGAYAVTARNITCAQFMTMSPASQKAAFKRVMAAMPAKSLSTSTTSTEGGNQSSQTGKLVPRNVGQVTAACQSASPSSTVRDALMHDMSPKSTTMN